MTAWAACQVRPNGTTFNATVGTAFSQTFTSNGNPCTGWSSTYLPGQYGLTFNAATGVLSGTPNGTTAGYSFTVSNGSDTNNYTIIISSSGCSFNGGSTGVINFAIDPSTTGSILGTVTTNVSFFCENGRAFTVEVTPASGWQLTGPGTINYTPGFINVGTGAGATPITLLTTTSQVLQADYQDAPYGNYSNSQLVTFTINCPTCASPNTIYAYLNASAGVLAYVSDTCGSATNGSLSFPIDPGGTGTLTASTTDAGNTSPSVKCTKNQSHSVSCSSAHGNRLTIGNDGTTDPIPYTITTCTTPIVGNGFSTIKLIPVGISIAQADYQNALTGAHSDTITVLVTY